MSRRCELTGTGPQAGNNVSHSQRKTRRRFDINLQKVTLFSESLGESFPFRVTAATLRSVDHNGGLDNFLISATANKLTEKAQGLRRRIKKARAEQRAAS